MDHLLDVILTERQLNAIARLAVDGELALTPSAVRRLLRARHFHAEDAAAVRRYAAGYYEERAAARKKYELSF